MWLSWQSVPNEHEALALISSTVQSERGGHYLDPSTQEREAERSHIQGQSVLERGRARQIMEWLLFLVFGFDFSETGFPCVALTVLKITL